VLWQQPQLDRAGAEHFLRSEVPAATAYPRFVARDTQQRPVRGSRAEVVTVLADGGGVVSHHILAIDHAPDRVWAGDEFGPMTRSVAIAFVVSCTSPLGVPLVSPFELDVQAELGALPWWCPHIALDAFDRSFDAPAGSFFVCSLACDPSPLNQLHLAVVVRMPNAIWRSFALSRVPPPPDSASSSSPFDSLYRLVSNDGLERLQLEDSRILLLLIRLQHVLGFHFVAETNSTFLAMHNAVVAHPSWLGSESRDVAEQRLRLATGHFVVRDARFPSCVKLTQSSSDGTVHHVVVSVEVPHMYISRLQKQEAARVASRQTDSVEMIPDAAELSRMTAAPQQQQQQTATATVAAAATTTTMTPAKTVTVAPADAFDGAPWFRPNITRAAAESQIVQWLSQPGADPKSLFLVRNAPAGRLAVTMLADDNITVLHRVVRIMAEGYTCDGITKRSMRELLLALGLTDASAQQQQQQQSQQSQQSQQQSQPSEPLRSSANLRALIRTKGVALPIVVNKGENHNSSSSSSSSSSTDEQFCAACATGAFTDVARLIALKSTNKNAVDAKGYSALLLAAINGHFAVCSLLIDQGADVCAVSESGATILHYLAADMVDAAQSLGLVKRLLALEASTSTVLLSTNLSGESPLHRAAGANRADVVRVLLDASKRLGRLGELLDARNLHGWPPIAFAARGGYSEVAHLLVDAGASLEPVGLDADVRRLSDMALLGGAKELSEWLADKSSGKKKDKDSAFARFKKALFNDDDNSSVSTASPAVQPPLRLGQRTCTRCNSSDVRARARLENGQQRWLCGACAVELGSLPPSASSSSSSTAASSSSSSSTATRGLHRARSFVKSARSAVLGGNPWHDPELAPVSRTTFLAALEQSEDWLLPSRRTAAAQVARTAEAALGSRGSRAALLGALVGDRAAAAIATHPALVVNERSECAADMALYEVGTFAVTVDAETTEPLLFWVAPRAQSDTLAPPAAAHDGGGVVLHAALIFGTEGVKLAGSTIWYASLAAFEAAFASALREPLPRVKSAKSKRATSDLAELLTLAVRAKLATALIQCGETHSAAQQLDGLLGNWRANDVEFKRRGSLASMAPLGTRVMDVARVPTLFYWRAHCFVAQAGGAPVAQLRLATAALSRAIVSLRPSESAELFNFRGLCAAAAGDIDNGVADLVRAVELNPLELIFAQNLDDVKRDRAASRYTRMLCVAADDIPVDSDFDDTSDLEEAALSDDDVDDSDSSPRAAVGAAPPAAAIAIVAPAAVDVAAGAAAAAPVVVEKRRPSAETSDGKRRLSAPFESAVASTKRATVEVDKQALAMCEQLDDQLSEVDACAMLSEALARVTTSEQKSEVVRDYVVLFRALCIRDEKRGSPYLMPAIVCRRMTDQMLLAMCHPQMLRVLLEYLPEAGENAIDSTISRLHRVCDEDSAFERAFDDAMELLTDAQVNSLFKSLKVGDMQWFLSFVSKRSVHNGGGANDLKTAASERFQVTQDRRGLVDKRTQQVVPLVPTIVVSPSPSSDSTPRSTVAAASRTGSSLMSPPVSPRSVQNADEQLQLSASFLAAWLYEYAEPGALRAAFPNAAAAATAVAAAATSTEYTVMQSTPSHSSSSAGPLPELPPFETYHNPSAPNAPLAAPQPQPHDSNNGSETNYVGIVPDEEVKTSSSDADSTAMLSGDAAVRSAFQSNNDVSGFAFVIPAGELIRRRKIGEGAFGVVYAGRWRHIDVAIKEIKFESEQQLRDFKMEARKMQNLRPHANIVTYYGLAYEPRFAIVTRYCAGGALDRRLYERSARDQPLSPALAHNLARGIAFGIAHLHHEGIVHRDISARNILLSASLEPLVADFGLARDTNDSADLPSVGALRWLAPEQLQSGAQHSRLSDMYSYGVTLYEILARRYPWFELTEVMEVKEAVLTGRKLEAPAESPTHLLAILEQCIATVPNERPTADDIATLLAEPMPETYSADEWSWVLDRSTMLRRSIASDVAASPVNVASDDSPYSIPSADGDDDDNSSNSRLQVPQAPSSRRKSSRKRSSPQDRIVAIDLRQLVEDPSEMRDQRCYRLSRSSSWSIRVPSPALEKPYRAAVMLNARIPIAVRAKAGSEVSLRLLAGKSKLEKGRQFRVSGATSTDESHITVQLQVLGVPAGTIVRVIGVVDGKNQHESMLIKLLRPRASSRRGDEAVDSQGERSDETSGDGAASLSEGEEVATPSAGRRKKADSSAPPPSGGGGGAATVSASGVASAPLPSLGAMVHLNVPKQPRQRHSRRSSGHRDSGTPLTSNGGSAMSSASATTTTTTSASAQASSSCRACKEEIGEREVALLIGATRVHARCFVCDRCKNKLDVDAFEPSALGVGLCAACVAATAPQK
jgi:serine/threonine protein kinase/ankyrin repeat protein